MVTKQLLIIGSLFLLSTTSFIDSNAFEKECMPGISLSDLRKKHAAQLEEFKKTEKHKKLEIRTQQFKDKQYQYAIAFGKCNCYKSSTTGLCAWINGCGEKDCVDVEQLQEELPKAFNALVYATIQAQESNKEFFELGKCIQEREYNNLSVTPSTETK